MRRSTATTSDDARRRQSAQPCGLRRHGPSAGVTPPRRIAGSGTPSSSFLGAGPWRSQRGSREVAGRALASPQAFRAAAKKPRVINVGIIGFGKMGRIRYETMTANGRGRVVAVADPLRPQLSGVPCEESAEALIENPAVEAVFICTPNYLNKPLTIRALRAGKHVFCEKPPAFTAPDIEEIIAVERTSGKQLMYGFNHRHHDSVKKAKELVDSGVYGRILWMRGRYGKSVDHNFYSTWRAKKSFAGGGILMDQGIHLLDLFLMMAGDFEELQAYVSNLYWKLDVEDNVFAILRNRQGVVASLHSTMTQWRHLFSFEIFLEQGYIVINGLLTPSGTYGAEAMTVAKNRTTAPVATWSDEERFEFEVNTSWRSEVRSFFDAILHDRPITVGSSKDAFTLMRLVDKIYAHA
ncbi:MAG: Gfo/Idh/MocA family oxidoreductase [Candidatus Omnitrophica bacterium]|nr:Gfo/Idh/MocA family oxidoreductase [Candidatus Omnitrophota bacterium]